MFGQFLANFGNPVDSFLGNIISAFAGNETAIQNVNKIGENIPSMMAEASGAILISGMTFMSENGDMIALAVYATGSVHLGVVVDGLTYASDITLNIIEYQKTGNSWKLKKELGLMAASAIATTATVNALGKGIKLGEKEFMEKVIPFVASLEGASLNKAAELIE
jgi:hypothetical protein